MKNSEWISIHTYLPGEKPTTITNRPGSSRRHERLFNLLRGILIDQGRWPFEAEAGKDSQISAPSIEQRDDLANISDALQMTRYRPILARGGASASEMVLADRGER